MEDPDGPTGSAPKQGQSLQVSPVETVLAAMVAAEIPVTSLSVHRLTAELLSRGCVIAGVESPGPGALEIT